jgi:hypothetical protein
LAYLEKEYQRDVVKDLVRVPLEAVWSALDVEGRVVDALQDIRVEALAGGKNGHSLIPGTVSVVAKIVVKDFGEVTLFKSNRYRERSLVQFGETYGWQHVLSVDGLDESFKQIVLSYSTKGENTG